MCPPVLGTMGSLARKPGTDIRPVAGVKRPAEDRPSLLPAFEPVSSSPPLPRPVKRIARASPDGRSVLRYSPSKSSNGKPKYPTPAPTSSTGILSSSPPPFSKSRRPGLQRTASTLSERAPLASVRSIELDTSGQPVLMGRSGKSSHYQLSTNKFISRIHVQAAYIPADELHQNRVEIVCTGHNGVKIHCQGKAWELGKEDSFTSESQDVDIMVDVHGARVLLRWPSTARKVVTPSDTDSNGESDQSPYRPVAGVVHRSPFSSPLRRCARLQSPVSPSPAGNLGGSSILSEVGAEEPIQIYEDDEDDKENEPCSGPTQPTQLMSQPLGQREEEDEAAAEDFSDQDEENEPLVHTMGPFGHNLQARMASFSTVSPNSKGKLDDLPRTSRSSSQENKSPDRQPLRDTPMDDATRSVLNHVVNQLAYSRLSSTPLSMLLNNLPMELRIVVKSLGENELDILQILIDRLACVGEVRRAGKDAAGKPLESEYYYVCEKDFDQARRDAVGELRKPGLRNCRKQHKVKGAYHGDHPKLISSTAILLAQA